MPDICDHANDEMEFLNQIKFSRPPSPVVAVRQYQASGVVWIARPSWNT